MATQALTRRIERLEQAHGINRRTVRVVIACERCGHWLVLGDHHTACGSHPKLSPANLAVRVTFGNE